MMVTDLRCWWQNHYVGDFFRYVGDFLNVLNRSPTSWIGHQHLKLVTNTFGLQHPLPTSIPSFLPALHCKIKIIFFKFILLCMYKWSRNSSFSIFWSRDWFNINLRKPLKVNNGIQFPYDFFYFELENQHQILQNSESEHHQITKKDWIFVVSYLVYDAHEN